ncbi:MAG: hypothetical protein JWR67_712 [Mucilaginibacter sp.]|nr:hypothetical protein [Mucilaginibacter sp.]
MYKFFLIICFVIVFACTAKAQQLDTLNKKSKTNPELQSKRDSVKANPIVPKLKQKTWHPDSNHSPHRAVMHSLMIPGWGQVYNHQIWKVPLIYTALGLMTSVYIFNQRNYSINLKIAKDYQYGRKPAPGASEYDLYNQYQAYGYSATAINDAVAGYKRNEELGIFGFVAFWGIQMIDAYIDAKFKHSYTMDTDLSFKVTPQVLNQPVYAGNLNGSYIPGLKLTFTLR